MSASTAVIEVVDGTVPAPSALTGAVADKVACAQDLQREQCLLFVALTQARDHLYISYSGSPSTFLGYKIKSTRLNGPVRCLLLDDMRLIVTVSSTAITWLVEQVCQLHQPEKVRDRHWRNRAYSTGG